MADLGKVTGTITSLEMVGGTVGAIVSGVLFDATGSFASTWIVCLVCSVVMLVFLLASEPIAAKLRASVAGVDRPKRIAACPLRPWLPRRCIWPNESPYPRSVRRTAAVCVCAV